VQYRICSTTDAPMLAPLNLQLIRDEGHRNPMDVAQLAERMSGWLAGEYQAVVFEEGETAAGYALFRRDEGYVVLRQLFVTPERRRQGVARAALAWLWNNAWADAAALRVEVLSGNGTAREFWRSVGFDEYAVVLEAHPPGPVVVAGSSE
jgi:GNAT superfamily N-acetyltransferase